MSRVLSNSSARKLISAALAIVAVFCLWVIQEILSARPSNTSVAENRRWILFSDVFPSHPLFQSELDLMRARGKLTAENEAEIAESVRQASQPLAMPASLLWCLLFQESRLNHLAGAEEGRGAKGLGQFSDFSVFEVNYQMDRFSGDGVRAFRAAVGSDVRPIHVDSAKEHSASSYFSIPTAVAASAAYLNNRHAHLSKLLDKRELPYEPEIVWLYAAMAYNKGTRSILSLWNQLEARRSTAALILALTDFKAFTKLTSNKKMITKALSRIWPESTAEAYAAELVVHTAQITTCSIPKKGERLPKSF